MKAAYPRCRLGFNAEYAERHGVQILGSYRAYNPLLMCFHNPDNQSPFARGGLNAYAYCHGDPVNFVDPTGHYALAPLTLRTLHWVAGAGLTTAVIASVAGLALKNGKSREIAFGIAAGGLAVGIAAVAAPFWVDGGRRVRVQAMVTRLLQRLRPQRRETLQVVASYTAPRPSVSSTPDPDLLPPYEHASEHRLIQSSPYNSPQDDPFAGPPPYVPAPSPLHPNPGPERLPFLPGSPMSLRNTPSDSRRSVSGRPSIRSTSL